MGRSGLDGNTKPFSCHDSPANCRIFRTVRTSDSRRSATKRGKSIVRRLRSVLGGPNSKRATSSPFLRRVLASTWFTVRRRFARSRSFRRSPYNSSGRRPVVTASAYSASWRSRDTAATKARACSGFRNRPFVPLAWTVRLRLAARNRAPAGFRSIAAPIPGQTEARGAKPIGRIRRCDCRDHAPGGSSSIHRREPVSVRRARSHQSVEPHSPRRDNDSPARCGAKHRPRSCSTQESVSGSR